MIIFSKNLLAFGLIFVASMTCCMDKKKSSLDKKSTSSCDSPRMSPGRKSPQGKKGKGPQNLSLTASSGSPRTSVGNYSDLQAIMAKKQSERAQSEGSGSVK